MTSLEDCPPSKKADNDANSSRNTKGAVTQHAITPPSSRPNPYCFPERQLFTGLIYNGVAVKHHPVSVDPITHMKNIRSLQMKSDDLIITAFPKCGTHWVSEMLHMMVRGTTDYATQPKEFNMLEFIEDLTVLDQMTSPRVLNSHLYIAHLPEQVVEKKVKLVHLIRNPKDCAVSLYYHAKQHAPKEFTFDNFIKGYTTEDYTTLSHELNYLRQMSQFEKAHPDHPIIHIHYEDLKEDPVPILQGLSEFVGIQISRKFCEDIASACGFEHLKRADVARELPKNVLTTFENGINIYRKGVVGDWKNTFTVAQNEMFDQFMARQEEKGLPYNFRWH